MIKFESGKHVVWHKREQIISTAVAPLFLNLGGFYKFFKKKL